MESYKKLEEVFRRRHHLEHLMAIGHWDMAVMMPEGGSESRAHALAELQSLLIQQLQNSDIKENQVTLMTLKKNIIRR